MVKENSGSIVRGQSFGEFCGNGTNKLEHRGGNRGLRRKKYLRGNQNSDSNCENIDCGTKTAGVANFEQKNSPTLAEGL